MLYAASRTSLSSRAARRPSLDGVTSIVLYCKAAAVRKCGKARRPSKKTHITAKEVQQPAGCKKSRIMANHDAADFNRGVLRFACGFKLDVDLGKLGGNIADFVVIFYSVEVGR